MSKSKLELAKEAVEMLKEAQAMIGDAYQIFIESGLRQRDAKSICKNYINDSFVREGHKMLNCVLDEGGRCSALETNKCTTGCSFYLNKFQKAESDAKSAERLNSLSESKQEYIAEKYYSGKMVWKDDGHVAPAV